ncbi:hypothetical protein SFR_1466 [Streptomyces sp. FR-008]|nr:hypothetical protein SFR_1466 [Streptomyces sp. FR-008]
MGAGVFRTDGWQRRSTEGPVEVTQIGHLCHRGAWLATARRR